MMINDYSEVTATIKPKILKLDEFLEQKRFEEAQKLIFNLQADFKILETFVNDKLSGEI